jgi:hypothetical protein
VNSNAQAKIAIGKTSVDGDALVDFGTEVRGIVIAPVVNVTTMVASPGTIAFDGNTGSFRYLNNSGNWSTVIPGGATGGVQTGTGIYQTLIGSTSSATKGVIIFGKDTGENKALVLPKLANGNLRFNNPIAGLIYYDTVLKAIMVYNGTKWTRF